MCRKGWLVVALVLLAATTLVSAKDRVWTDTSGRTMRADFVREVDGDVTFIKDGKIITLALERLSERDQQVVRDLMAGKPVADDPVPAPQPASPQPRSRLLEPRRPNQKVLWRRTRSRRRSKTAPGPISMATR